MNLYDTYLKNVRWLELFLFVGIAFLGDLQVTIATGGKVDREALLKAGGVGLAVGWAYLRMPKAPETETEIDFGSLTPGSLPAGVDATGPAHDVGSEIVETAIHSALGPIGAAAPDLAKNITKELGRVLRRGIKW